MREGGRVERGRRRERAGGVEETEEGLNRDYFIAVFSPKAGFNFSVRGIPLQGIPCIVPARTKAFVPSARVPQQRLWRVNYVVEDDRGPLKELTRLTAVFSSLSFSSPSSRHCRKKQASRDNSREDAKTFKETLEAH